MLWPREVLPTPGGPAKHRMGARPCGLSLRTARYSTMRRLTLGRPKWSASSTPRAVSRSMLRGAGWPQGSSVIHSSQVRRMGLSPELSPMRWRRSSSLRAWASASGGMPALVMASSRRWVSCDCSPSSPSSLRMARICSCNNTRRWRSSNCSLVRAPISCDRRSTCRRCVTRSSTPRSLASVSRVSNSTCFCSGSASTRLAARSASCEGEAVACITWVSSAGTLGSSESSSAARSRSCSDRASA